MKNIGIPKVMEWGVDNFTTPVGLKIRRFINPVFRRLLKLGTRRKIIVEQYPKLEKGKPYIFASTHSFDDDVISYLSTIDRSTYFLAGTSEQILYNPQMYAGWANGMVYVDRLDPVSRKESVVKLKKVLEMGSSVLIYPEGGWNNTENLMVQPLFGGVYYLNRDTMCPVVPIATFHESGSDKIYVRAGESMSFENMEKKKALRVLRDEMATLVYEMMAAHGTKIKREELDKSDFRLEFMEERRQEYLRVPWTKDVWEEELTFYHDKDNPLPVKVWEFVDNVNVNGENAKILAPILVRRAEDKKYDFKEYMHKNWNRQE